ncbi:DUF397 domain-containing protein [Streptomyces sp. NPDC049577]|uniref:DUF397 domain-containing protein n=1 Tax=Streptomyces sp. NPDC049577 TaxID=3155153 RepID=UPI00341E1AEA
MNSTLTWLKSSYSNAHADNCVEVHPGPREIRIRDSKRVPGPELSFPHASWATFVAALAPEG